MTKLLISDILELSRRKWDISLVVVKNELVTKPPGADLPLRVRDSRLIVRSNVYLYTDKYSI